MRKPEDFCESGTYGELLLSVEQDEDGRYLDFGWTTVSVKDAKRLRAWLEKAILWLEEKS